ncbi:peptide deformylase [Spiroplasma sabaudiense Ar-1343]|uniref:Peptide deformylase n=1 Tax=Spiroplasma sabaudiense Ar-1343 TaxID=1276257 RepID=W6AK15_9MOLU|nr:peptide deformylase [Spiroplasma sabaudiense]AHI54069.1 peptide deformylase [Spiroplasma sabaudiense Ar-1343]
MEMTYKDLLQKERPSNEWLFKDNNTEVIRSVSSDVQTPLSEDHDLVMRKLIDFVRVSQCKTLNKKGSPDFLRPAVGLAAPQIGSNTNMFFARFEWEKNEEAEEYAIINGRITASSPQVVALEGGEGCLSVDSDHPGVVPRSYKISVEGIDYFTNQAVTLNLRGYKAIVFQHELLHNQGVLYYDLINKDDPEFIDEDWILL